MQPKTEIRTCDVCEINPIEVVIIGLNLCARCYDELIDFRSEDWRELGLNIPYDGQAPEGTPIGCLGESGL